ncbi:MAG: hypothetical protein AAGC55_28040, partial [Myxococcota bacterium]
YPGLLAEILAQLPAGRDLRAAKIHSASDDDFVLDVFTFAAADQPPARFDPADAKQQRKRTRALAFAERAGHDPAPEDGGLTLDQFITLCTGEYVATVTPFRLVDNWLHCRLLFGTDDTEVTFQSEDDAPGVQRIAVATGGETPRMVLERIARYFAHKQLDIRRAYLDRFDGGAERAVHLFSFVVQSSRSDGLSGAIEHTIRRDLVRIKWMQERALALAYRHPELGLDRAELIHALAELIHPTLAAEDGQAFSRDGVHSICAREFAFAAAIADLFAAAFDPAQPLSEDARDEEIRALVLRMEREVTASASRRVLTQLLLAVQATRATNVHDSQRHGLTIHFDPGHLGQAPAEWAPVLAWFGCGRGFTAFCLSLGPSALGDIRVLRPDSRDQHALDAERLYARCAALARRRHQGNLGLPHAGAGALVLLEPDTPVRRSARALLTSWLDERLGLAGRVHLRTGRDLPDDVIA